MKKTQELLLQEIFTQDIFQKVKVSIFVDKYGFVIGKIYRDNFVTEAKVKGLAENILTYDINQIKIFLKENAYANVMFDEININFRLRGGLNPAGFPLAAQAAATVSAALVSIAGGIYATSALGATGAAVETAVAGTATAVAGTATAVAGTATAVAGAVAIGSGVAAVGAGAVGVYWFYKKMFTTSQDSSANNNSNTTHRPRFRSL